MTITQVTNPDNGYNKRFEHIVDLRASGVNSRYIQWCDKNCEYNWGWHFWQNGRASTSYPWNDPWVPPKEVLDNTRAFMSFQDYDEMIIFKITCLSA